ncbi:MAG: helix-turn-helix domain-containing protein [Mycobacteriales bacterium]
MEAPEMLRTARRRAGLSQRAMAAASGIGTTTLAAVEAGRRAPSLVVLNAVLAAAGLELAVDRPVEAPCRHVRRHLHDSLTVRLHRWLGGNGDPRGERTLPLWCQLRALAATGRVELPGPAALGLWLPGLAPPAVLEAGFRAHPGSHAPPCPTCGSSDCPVDRPDR